MSPAQRENLSLLTDLELVARYKNTLDKLYVGELFKRYSHLVLGLCINYFKDKDDAKDALVQIFEKLFDELRKREVENFRVWLCFVSRNYCISALRKRKTEESRQDDYERGVETFVEMETPLRHDDKELQLQQLEEAIKQLSEEQRICVELFYLQERSYQDISAATGYSLKEVKSFLQNGKRNLKNILTRPEVVLRKEQ
ncbi:MAG TPA: sigma-70 family RNA polymerase sigma factor [Bacteroidia bacterium]|jgi:RNA polymerase sigma-70 factor (ECF subfamily)